MLMYAEDNWETQLTSALDNILLNKIEIETNVEGYINHKNRLYEEEWLNSVQKLSQAVENEKAFTLQCENKSKEMQEHETILKSLELQYDGVEEITNNEILIQLEVDRQKAQAIQTKRDSLLRKLEQRRLYIETRKLAHEQNKQTDKIELTALIKNSQMDIVGVKANLINFIFGCIDKKAPKRKCHIILNLLESGRYEVTECVPELPALKTLLDVLNNDRDIYSFLKRVRKSFVDLYNPV